MSKGLGGKSLKMPAGLKSPLRDCSTLAAVEVDLPLGFSFVLVGWYGEPGLDMRQARICSMPLWGMLLLQDLVPLWL